MVFVGLTVCGLCGSGFGVLLFGDDFRVCYVCSAFLHLGDDFRILLSPFGFALPSSFSGLFREKLTVSSWGQRSPTYPTISNAALKPISLKPEYTYFLKA